MHSHLKPCTQPPQQPPTDKLPRVNLKAREPSNNDNIPSNTVNNNIINTIYQFGDQTTTLSNNNNNNNNNNDDETSLNSSHLSAKNSHLETPLSNMQAYGLKYSGSVLFDKGPVSLLSNNSSSNNQFNLSLPYKADQSLHLMTSSRTSSDALTSSTQRLSNHISEAARDEGMLASLHYNQPVSGR